MKKEDYELIASVLRENRPEDREHEQTVWQPIMQSMGDMLANGDAQFDYDLFHNTVWGAKIEELLYFALYGKQNYQYQDIRLKQDSDWSVANLYMGKHVILHVSYMKDSNGHRSVLLRPAIDGIEKSDPVRVVKFLSYLGVDIHRDNGIIYINGLPLE